MPKPIIKKESAIKVAKYFFAGDWRKYPVVEIAVRHKKINFYDDELAVINNATGEFKTFNWNADPSMLRKAGKGLAILRKGVHFYRISYHHIWNNLKRYVALRPNTPNEQLKVWRTNQSSRLYEDFGTAINQHRGGANSTWSEGCQTAPPDQYAEFINFIASGFGVKIPVGIQRRADEKFVKGIGNIPYILLDQADFDYIINLPESQFDSQTDLIYQQKHFVNIPKVEKQLPIISAPSPNAEQILAEIAEKENQAALSAAITEDNFDEKFEQLKSSAVVPASFPAEINNQLSANPLADSVNLSANLPNQSIQNEQPPINSGAVETTEIQTENVSAQITATKNEQDVNIPAEVAQPAPQGVFKKLATGISTLFSGTAIYTAAEKFGGVTISQTVLILIITAVVLGFIGFLFWAWLDAWKSNNRIKHEISSKTALDKKDVKWV